MPTIHPKARTTPAVRAEIARSREPTGILAQRYGVSTETIRKWRKRGAADCQDHSSRPHKLPWKASEEERAIVCALRRASTPVGSIERAISARTAGVVRAFAWIVGIRTSSAERAWPAAQSARRMSQSPNELDPNNVPLPDS